MDKKISSQSKVVSISVNMQMHSMLLNRMYLLNQISKSKPNATAEIFSVRANVVTT